MKETSEILSKTQYALLSFLNENKGWHAQKDLIKKFNDWSPDIKIAHTSLMSSLSRLRQYSFINVLMVSKYNFICINTDSTLYYCDTVSDLKKDDSVKRAPVEVSRSVISKMGNGLSGQELSDLFESII